MRCVHNSGTKTPPQFTVTRVPCQLAKSSVPIAAQVEVEHPNIATFYDIYAPLNKGLALKHVIPHAQIIIMVLYIKSTTVRFNGQQLPLNN